jgi:hypothetical protein
VTDDVGSTYAAAATPGSGSGPFMTRLQVQFAPAPPPTAQRLELRIEEFVDPFPRHRLGAVSGPWVFAISLADQGQPSSGARGGDG